MGGANMHDTFYAKSMMTPMEVPLTDEAMGAMMEYLGTVGRDGELLEVELCSGVNSAINALPLDDTAFANRTTLRTFQPYASSPNSLLPYPEEGFGFMDGIVKSIVDNMPPGWGYGAYPNYIDDWLGDCMSRFSSPLSPPPSTLSSSSPSLPPSPFFSIPYRSSLTDVFYM
ncbi:hypothetical protein D9758_018062 [Tetrapyrgos nigripes]|uniref:Uncharacterized protein n=1 Tax=Tetrapyrgos nigripes TaxID=182062 RepID=A0A8H5F468_9AGAR|nr:hypothetical protein D9758_018062 [Tetrapyrgos nigripes]